MAIVTGNNLTTGFRGMIADTLVFRNVNGKTIVSARPSKPRRQSERQRKNRSKFQEATYFAHAMTQDTEKKAYYTRKAKEQGLPNAYTAAITEFMRKPEEKVVEVKEEVVVKTNDQCLALERLGMLTHHVNESARFISNNGVRDGILNSPYAGNRCAVTRNSMKYAINEYTQYDRYILNTYSPSKIESG